MFATCSSTFTRPISRPPRSIAFALLLGLYGCTDQDKSADDTAGGDTGQPAAEIEPLPLDGVHYGGTYEEWTIGEE